MIGEFHIYTDSDLSDVEKKVIKIAKDREMFLHAHAHIGAIKKFFVENPRAKILWAHAGFVCAAICPPGVDPLPNPTPAEIAAMLAKHRQLLLNKYPDRFLLGTDTFKAPFAGGPTGNRWDILAPIAGEMRSWLNKEDFSEHVRYLLARGNAERLFGVHAAK